jgi:hypothetical protein
LICDGSVRARPPCAPAWAACSRALFGEKLSKQKRLRFESFGVFIARQQTDQLVAKDGDTTRLESDDRDAGADLRAQSRQYFAQHRFGQAKHPIVIQRTAAAKPHRRNRHMEAGIL